MFFNHDYLDTNIIKFLEGDINLTPLGRRIGIGNNNQLKGYISRLLVHSYPNVWELFYNENRVNAMVSDSMLDLDKVELDVPILRKLYRRIKEHEHSTRTSEST